MSNDIRPDANVAGGAVILFLASNPDDVEPLALDKECRAIRERIRAAEYPKGLRLEKEWAVRTSDLLQYFREHRPDVVHFSGHGTRTRQLIFHDQTDQPKAVSTRALRELFALESNIRLVVLNACYSELQAKAIVQSIDCAVGMKSGISDSAARVFAGAFYRALGFGLSVRAAFDDGLAELGLEGINERHIPKLLVKSGVDARQVFLAGPASSGLAATRQRLDPNGNKSGAVATHVPDQARFSCAISLRPTEKIDLLGCVAHFLPQLGTEGLGELRPGLHLGRPRKLQLQRIDQNIALETYPSLIEISSGKRLSAIPVKPADSAKKDTVYEFRPTGNRSRVRLSLKIRGDDPLTIVLEEQTKAPKTVVFTITLSETENENS